MSTLRAAIRTMDVMVECEATDGLIMAAEVVEELIFKIFVGNGMHVIDAREWARLLTKEMQE